MKVIEKLYLNQIMVRKIDDFSKENVKSFDHGSFLIEIPHFRSQILGFKVFSLLSIINRELPKFVGKQ